MDMKAKIHPKLGKIYVLSNQAMPGFLKIGFTQKHETEARIVELSKQTAVPLPFVLEYEQTVENPQQTECLIHARLESYRVSPDKEFFRVDLSTAERTIRKVVLGEGAIDTIKELKHLIELFEKFPEAFSGTETTLPRMKEALAKIEAS
jgi:hypothetical protein